MNEKVLLIPKIENGIVIDHIPAGLGTPILRTIVAHPAAKNVVITLGLNYKSSKLGSKDMIKIDIDDLPESILKQIALMAAGVTVKRVKNFAVDKKYVIQTPDVLLHLVRCRNPNCITNHEPSMKTEFHAINSQRQQYKCCHCERIFGLQELERLAAAAESAGQVRP